MCEYIILEDLLYGQVHFESMEGDYGMRLLFILSPTEKMGEPKTEYTKLKKSFFYIKDGYFAKLHRKCICG